MFNIEFMIVLGVWVELLKEEKKTKKDNQQELIASSLSAARVGDGYVGAPLGTPNKCSPFV